MQNGLITLEVFDTSLSSSLYQVCDSLIADVYWHLDKVVVFPP